MAKIARDGDLIQPWNNYGYGFGIGFTQLDDTAVLTRSLSTTLANGIPVGRVGGYTYLHYHSIGRHLILLYGYFPSGSTDTFADGLGILRIGDIANCGCRLATGSPDVEAD